MTHIINIAPDNVKNYRNWFVEKVYKESEKHDTGLILLFDESSIICLKHPMFIDEIDLMLWFKDPKIKAIFSPSLSTDEQRRILLRFLPIEYNDKVLSMMERFLWLNDTFLKNIMQDIGLNYDKAKKKCCIVAFLQLVGIPHNIPLDDNDMKYINELTAKRVVKKSEYWPKLYREFVGMFVNHTA